MKKRILCCMGWHMLKPSKSTVSFFLLAWNSAVCFLMGGYDLLKVTQKWVIWDVPKLYNGQHQAFLWHRSMKLWCIPVSTSLDWPCHSSIFFIFFFLVCGFLMLTATDWCCLCSQHVHYTITAQVPLAGFRAITPCEISVCTMGR